MGLPIVLLTITEMLVNEKLMISITIITVSEIRAQVVKGMHSEKIRKRPRPSSFKSSQQGWTNKEIQMLPH
jgi:hypothetical protein